MATWYELIERAMEQNSESMSDVVASTFTGQAIHVEFDDGYGATEGIAFTLWTHKYVYFPATYDGSEWCASVPRDPSNVAMSHVGGG